MPLYGAPIVSFRTSAAALRRFVVSLSAFVRAFDLLTHGPELATSANRATAKINFVILISFPPCLINFRLLFVREASVSFFFATGKWPSVFVAACELLG